MIEQIQEGLYRISVGLPQNPLRQLNSYVICGRGRNLIIDTGFNRPECLKDLQDGIRALGLDMDHTDLFLTHLHSDHTGLAQSIVSPHSTIYMGEADWNELNATLQDPLCWQKKSQIFLQEGFPALELEQALAKNPARLYQPNGPLDAVPVQKGDILTVGGIALEPILTPGHTPGHLCLYWPEQQILFSGDHILFQITPNISVWECMENPLSDYFTSLGKIAQLPISCCLPGHRIFSTAANARISALLRHHRDRLQEILKIIARQPYSNGYQIAQQMHWDIRSKSWEDFPVGQKWFAVGEALAHLAFLVHCGALSAQGSANGIYYHIRNMVNLEAVIDSAFGQSQRWS